MSMNGCSDTNHKNIQKNSADNLFKPWHLQDSVIAGKGGESSFLRSISGARDSLNKYISDSEM